MSGILLAVWLGTIGPIGAVPPPPAPSTGAVPAPCTCATAEATSGWCDAHGVGYVASVRIRSRMLYDTLDAHGHAVDPDTFDCVSCKKAIESSGFCSEHQIGFVRGQAYFSRLTYELARGETKDPAKITCPVCRRNARSHGWCERHEIGMIGSVAIEDKDGYRAVEKAREILLVANKTAERCEYCAVAIVHDSDCPMCRITYKDGKPMPSPTGRPASGSN